MTYLSFFLYRPHPDDPQGGLLTKSLRQGYVGFLGFGGSVLQWHPELKIGFAYVPTRYSWYDFVNNHRAAKLQRLVAECARKLKE